MKQVSLIGSLLLLLTLVAVTEVPAQDFAQLLEAVDKIEANLKQLVEQEAKQRSAEIAELAKTIGHSGSKQSAQKSNEQLAILALNMKALRADMDRLLAGSDLSGSTNVDLIEIVSELESLKSELGMLRGLVVKSKGQLATLDNEGFYLPSEKSDAVSTRLAGLEATVADMAKDGTTSNPSVKHGKISLGGMVNEHFVSGPDETSTFVSKRARLAVKGDINEYAQIKVQAEFAKSPKLLDGQVTISPNSNWSISMGQYKPPFGTDFLISATSTPFVNRSLAAGLGTDRDVGGTVSFRTKFSPDYSLKLTAGVFNGAGINTSDVNNSKNFVARLETTLMGMFTLAPNVYIGKTNDIDMLKGDLVDLGSSLTWNWGQEIIEMEVVQSEHADIKRRSWYVWGGHMFNIGSNFLPQLQLLARYEQHDPNVNVDADRTDRITVGTNVFIDKKYTKIQLNYQINTEQGVSVNNNEFLVNFQLAF